jgi:hypothetical protein
MVLSQLLIQIIWPARTRCAGLVLMDQNILLVVVSDLMFCQLVKTNHSLWQCRWISMTSPILMSLVLDYGFNTLEMFCFTAQHILINCEHYIMYAVADENTDFAYMVYCCNTDVYVQSRRHSWTHPLRVCTQTDCLPESYTQNDVWWYNS